MTPAEVAERLCVAVETVYKLIRTGQLRASNIGSEARPQYRIRHHALEAMLDRTEVRGIAGEV